MGYIYLDTGAMYRAVGLCVHEDGIDLDDSVLLGGVLDDLDLQLLPGGSDTKVLLRGRDVSLSIRSAAMGMMASKVSAYGIVRDKMMELQRQIAQGKSVVAEGRDMGTVVFPTAHYKFYLNASLEERARRRTSQLKEQGMPADYKDIIGQIRQRDEDDSSRALAPLRPAGDAVLIDCSVMDVSEVLQCMLKHII